ncbi:winged helix-turn-helix domain-containing protein [Streptosporangium sp. 'caverna']|uniref:GntR family transcriptional regulator n=1 Tax=Streptosporangium sp. 'caverna' TaxID=2202249 RepID=UPI001EF87C1B|nr:winged helix-turn-helix domain-containing protein [Streptosporangium sp. 'caverna']
MADVLRKRIASGTYKRGYPVPAESAMQQEFEIARGTARKIIAKLRDEGLIYTVPGLGSFVGPPPDEDEAES